jgi:serine/threonine protein kinase
VKVLDFGVAKQITAEAGGESDITVSRPGPGNTQGGLPYVSPEQLRGQAVQAVSDIFSFGLVLYEMLAGAHPFHRDSPMDAIAGILDDDPPPLSLRLPSVPPLLQDIIAGTLAKDPARRYQRIQDVRRDIQQVLAQPSSRPRPLSGPGHGGPRRHRLDQPLHHGQLSEQHSRPAQRGGPAVCPADGPDQLHRAQGCDR